MTQIVGGQLSSGEGHHATVAKVLAQGSAHCSGVLVAPRRVATAAHCVAGADAVSLPSGEQFDVVDAEVRPSWWVDADLAWLALDRVAEVDPAQLGELGGQVEVVGYGDDGAGVFALRSVTLDVVACETCGPREFAAAGQGDACDGDSGAPAFNEAGELVGLASRGLEASCGPGGIYVDPTPDWAALSGCGSWAGSPAWLMGCLLLYRSQCRSRSRRRRLRR